MINHSQHDESVLRISASEEIATLSVGDPLGHEPQQKVLPTSKKIKR